MLPCLKWLQIRSWPTPVAAAVCVALMSLRVVLDFFYAIPGATENQFFANFPRFLEIFAGAVLGAALMGKENRLIEFLRRDIPLLSAVCVAGTLLLTIRLEFGSEAMHNFTRILFLPFALWIVTAGYFNRGWCYRIASHSIIVFFARISILIWLLHVPIRNLIVRLGAMAGLSQGPLLVAASVGVLFVTAAILEPMLAAVYRAFTRSPRSFVLPNLENRAPSAR